MRNKLLLTLLSLVCVFCCVFALTACGSSQVQGAHINPSQVELVIDGGMPLLDNLIISPSGASLKGMAWSSSNTDVAIVDENGNVRAVGIGTASVTVEFPSSASASCTVTVKAKPQEENKELLFVLNKDDGGASYYLKGVESKSTSVVIPAQYNGKPVTKIGQRALANSAVTSVTVPDSVKVIDESAFEESKLVSIALPGVTDIGQNAFRYCNDLASVQLSDDLVSIGFGAFDTCSKLASITLPAKLQTIANRAFAGCAIAQITLPASVTTIGGGAFARSALTSITIPEGVTVTDEIDFGHCENLESVTVLGEATALGTGAFTGAAKLTNITLPDSITSMGIEVFYHCKELTTVKLPAGLTSVSNYAFCGCSKLESVVMPDSIKTIGELAFNTCEALQSINFPQGLTSIGDAAFSFCTALKEVELPQSVTEIGSGAFAKCKFDKLYVLGDDVSIGEYAFNGASCAEAKMTIPTFKNLYLYGIQTLVLTGGTTIDAQLGSALNGVETLTLPETLTSIEDGAFTSNSNLNTLYWNVPAYAGVTSAFTACRRLTSVVFGDNVTSIPQNAFKDCTHIAEIEIPANVKTIGDDAFSGCTALTALTLNAGLQTLGDISNLPLLAALAIPADVACGDIRDCAILEDVTFAAGVDLSRTTFENCPKYVGTVIGDYTLRGTKLTSVASNVTMAYIPSVVQTIGANAFANAANLKYIYVPLNVTSVETDAFAGCENATVLCEGRNLSISDISTSTKYLNVGKCNADGWIYSDSGKEIAIRGYIGEGGEVTVPTAIDGKVVVSVEARGGANNLTSVFLGRSDITKITFNCATLNIEAGALENLANLTEIAFGANVTRVNMSKAAFEGCSQLNKISLAGGYTNYQLVTAAHGQTLQTSDVVDASDLFAKINGAATGVACVIMLKSAV